MYKLVLFSAVFLLLLGFSTLSAATITVELKDGSGAYITSGATLRYHDGAWKTDATNNGNGTWTINTSAASLYYEMTYNYGVQQIGPTSTATTTITFRTTTTTVRLEKADHTGLDGGAAQYTPGGAWHNIGTTTAGNAPAVELLPVSYYFGMTYNHGYQQFSPLTIPGGGSYTVTFTTTATTVRLETSDHIGLDGGVARYTPAGAWHNIGTTSGGDAPVLQLLPGSYYFDMDYNHGRQQVGLLAVSGASQTVTFTTTATTVRLETSLHAGLDGGAARYNQGAWWDIGTTTGGNAPIIQLLPGSYFFDMAFNNGKQQVGPLPVSGNAQTVTFQTTKVTVRLENCSHTGFAGGVAQYNQSSWNPLPNTDTNGNTNIELLPGNYYFDMKYNYGRQQVGPLAVAGNSQTVLFQTTSVSLEGSGTKEYHQGAWHTFTNPIDLLPGSYYFKIAGVQVGPYNVSGCTFYRAFVTVELRNGAGGFITSGGSLRYHDGSWKTDAVDNHNGTFSVIATAPSVYYEMTYNYGKQQIGPYPATTSPVTFQTTATTVRLENSAHTGFAGGIARFNQGAWNSFGTTGASGDAPPMELLPGSYYFDMDFNHGHHQLGPLTISGDVPHAQTVLFQTTTTTVQLLSGGGGGLSGGVAGYNQSAWHNFGTTDGTGLAGVQELLPGSYYFDMVYNNGRQQIGPTNVAGNTQTITFTTTTTTVRLTSGGSGGGLPEGVARFNQSTWQPAGTTGADGNISPGLELLPGSYYFDMVYNSGRQQLGPMNITGLTQTVTFTTTTTIVRLETHLGAGLKEGVARYNQGTWQPAGTTAEDGNISSALELLPGSYYFDMVYNKGRQQIGALAIAGPTQTVTFKTTATTVRLENCGHTGFSGGAARYHQGTWNSFGTTEASGNTPAVELLPGSYYFDMNYNYGRQQLGPLAVAGNTKTVLFQTTTVTISGTATTEYHQGAWHTFNSPIDLLPGSYYFRVGGNQIGPLAVSGCTFNRTLVTITLQNHLGVGLSGGVARWHNGSSWENIGTTPGSGKLFALVNLTGVYYDMKYKNATQQVGSFAAQNYIFKTTEVSLNLQDHTGGLITATDAGAVSYYSPTTSTWYTIGNTGTNGYVRIELLPVSGYYFRMTNKNVYQQVGPMAVTTGPTQNVDFKTTEVSLNLKDHTGGLITDTDAGAASYYSPTTSTWYTIGNTGINGYVRIELLPASGYYFRMTNKNVYQQVGQMAVTTGPTQDVDFKTTEVLLNLKDHTGGLMTDTDAGAASYYSPTTSTWYTIGNTGTNGYVRIELLPVNNYHFRMTYAYVSKQIGPMAVSLGPTQAVDFQTGQLTVRLEDASHNPLSGGNARYHDGAAWRNIGITDGTGMLSRELLPQNYYVDMTQSSQNKQHYPVAVTAGGTITTTFTWNGSSLSKPGEQVVVIPQEFGLSQNYPNPFNPTTTIDFQLPEEAEVTLAIYNVMGEKVRNLEQGQKTAGSYKAIWDGRNDQGEMVANGLYIYRLTAGTFTAVKRMVFMK